MNINIKMRTENLNIWRGTQHVLKNVTISIPKNQITVIIGPSGCGKSTLLRSLNRLIELFDDVKIKGNIYMDGVDIYNGKLDVTEIRKKIGFIQQVPTPLPMSIYDNVAHGPRVHGLREKAVLNKRVEECLRSVGLWDEIKDRLHMPATQLSIGQLQRLCIARSLAVEPEVLLCDEPTSALDPISAGNIEKLLQKLKKEYTIVLVTHTLRQAKRIADNVVFIYLGEVVEQGPTESVFINPEEEKTKEYIKGEIS